MKKVAILLALCAAISTPLHPQSDTQTQWDTCMSACRVERPNPELQRQEIIALEKEAARAIQNGDPTFFRRVYSDDFTGVLSRGETANKATFIAAMQNSEVRYESFTASDITVKLYRDVAVATGTWSLRAVVRGERVSSQMRVLHVYLYSGGGYHVTTAQGTLLPPYLEQPL